MISTSKAALIGALTCLLISGCASGGGQLGTLQSQNRTLTEQTKAQLAEIENLKSHARRLEDKLIEAEQQLAVLDQRINQGGKRMAAGTKEPASVYDRSSRE